MQQDNDWKQTANWTKEFITRKKYKVLLWQRLSSDFNPTEGAIHLLGGNRREKKLSKE